jgi:hypothetical protein
VPVVVPVHVPVKVPPKVTVGVPGMTKPEGRVTLMVLPEARLPPEEVVKPTVQVEVTCATSDAGEKVTLVLDEAVIVISEAGFALVS